MGKGSLRAAATMILREKPRLSGGNRTVANAAGTQLELQKTAALSEAKRPVHAATVQRVSPVENGSIYFIPYRYYPRTSERIFSSRAGWLDRERYKEFLGVLQGKMAPYSREEAKVICEIFRKDMRLMFVEKAIQEMQDCKFGLSEQALKRQLDIYSKELAMRKKEFFERKSFLPPPEFGKNELWFATFSQGAIPGIVSGGREHAGSIYFSGGRIRLMHIDGPILEDEKMIRTLAGERLEKDDDTLRIASLIREARRRGRKKISLYEYNAELTHWSRGYPKKVILRNEEIGQLYYVTEKITELRKWNDKGLKKEYIIAAGNKLLKEFLRGHGRLSRELGYEGIL